MHSKILKRDLPFKEIVLVAFVVFYIICMRNTIFAELDVSVKHSYGPEYMIPKECPTLLSRDEDWLTAESTYFTIYFKTTTDFKAIERKLKRRRFYYNGNSSSKYLDNPVERVAHRLDVLYKKVRDILNMHPNRSDIKVVIFKNQKELDDEYYSLFKQRKSYTSFYIYKYDTIYTCEKNISDSVMAHEMGHAVIDHYFLILPPENIKEMLASYVDEHLEN